MKPKKLLSHPDSGETALLQCVIYSSFCPNVSIHFWLGIYTVVRNHLKALRQYFSGSPKRMDFLCWCLLFMLQITQGIILAEDITLTNSGVLICSLLNKTGRTGCKSLPCLPILLQQSTPVRLHHRSQQTFASSNEAPTSWHYYSMVAWNLGPER